MREGRRPPTSRSAAAVRSRRYHRRGRGDRRHRRTKLRERKTRWKGSRMPPPLLQPRHRASVAGKRHCGRWETLPELAELALLPLVLFLSVRAIGAVAAPFLLFLLDYR
ncbi:uncharacterized protein DS421_17g581430 [Arachis hypogaea]|nr:uncharacterized protein DS421_17g581430 [Arachis hypogaea]